MYTVASAQPGRSEGYPLVSVIDGGHSEWFEAINERRILLRGLVDTPLPPAELEWELSDNGPEQRLWMHLVDDVRATVLGDEGFSPLGWPTTDVARVGAALGNEINAGSDGELSIEHIGAPAVTIWMWKCDGGVGALTPSFEGFIAALPEAVSEVNVAYTPQRPSELELAYGALREATAGAIPANGFEEMLLWRAYLGESSLFADGLSVIGWGRPSQVHKVRLPLVAGRRLIVGRIVHVGLRRANRADGDPTYLRRLRRLQLPYAATAASCPDLSEIPVGDAGARIVVVHGTMSCALPIAEALRERLPPDAEIRRYEHDTFRPIPENARCLAEEILRRPNLSPISILGHSRGGLVARHAAEIVGKEDANRSIRVVTLGTPFKGTPIVDVLLETVPRLAQLAWLGVSTAKDSGLPVLDRLTRTISLLHRLPRFPDGVAEMKTRSSYLQAAALYTRAGISTYSGEYPHGLEPHGYRFIVDMQPAFENDPNDLVVSVSSATIGAGYKASVCHSGYFADTDTLDRLTLDLAPPAPVI